jgi:hypothetical protein
MRSVIAAPFIPISFQIHSHRAAQGVIYADILKESGHCDDITVSMSRPSVQGADAIEANKTEDFNQYDRLYMYHGNDRKADSTDLNFFGGVKEFPHAYNIRNISWFKGEVYSVGYDMPDYATMLENKLRHFKEKYPNFTNSTVEEFYQVDIDNLRKMQQRAITIVPKGPWNKMAAGDSHAICLYRPGWNVNSVPFKTLHGALNEGLESFITDPDVEHVEFYFGNIDIRHHVCRLDAPYTETIEKLVDNYIEQVYNMKYKSKAIYELLPIENERRNIPKSGWYEGKPFWGTWAERNEARKYFNERVKAKTKDTDIEFKEWITPEFYNAEGEMDFKVMERPKSVHISREYYPYWQGLEYNGIKKTTLEDFFS